MSRVRSTAVDGCEPWCVVTDREHQDHRDPHQSQSDCVEMWGSQPLQSLYVALSRPYVDGMPLREVPDRHVTIDVCIDDDDPVLQVTPAVARSLAASLLRMADLHEGGRRG